VTSSNALLLIFCQADLTRYLCCKLAIQSDQSRNKTVLLRIGIQNSWLQYFVNTFVSRIHPSLPGTTPYSTINNIYNSSTHSTWDRNGEDVQLASSLCPRADIGQTRPCHTRTQCECLPSFDSTIIDNRLAFLGYQQRGFASPRC
jgi:hypothetical protein